MGVVRRIRGLLQGPKELQIQSSSRTALESPGIASDTLVGERDWTPDDDLEYHGAR